MSEALETLSDSQKVCLRLVAKGMTSKEIAQATGLAPQTIDTYIKVAMGRLNAPTRREAARQLATYELPHKLGSPPAPVADQPARREQKGATEERGWVRAMAPPPLGGTVNELSPAQRTYAVLKVAAISATVIFALVLFVAGMFETFR